MSRISNSLNSGKYDLQSRSYFDNEYNSFSGSKIKRLKVCGERCSGTNFLYYLLHANFPDLKQTQLFEYGHKHFLWWFGSTAFTKLEPLRYEFSAVDMVDSSDCLFVVVVRDPYDWLRSFFSFPHLVHEDLLNRGFSHFLRSQWKLVDEPHPLDGSYKEIDNYNPWTNKPFSNVLELRKYKMQNYLTLSKLVDNYMIVRYEDVRDAPEAFIHFIATKYLLNKKEVFTPITTLKGSHVPYVPKKYFSFSEEDLYFINANIDWDIEEKINYYLKHEVE